MLGPARISSSYSKECACAVNFGEDIWDLGMGIFKPREQLPNYS